MLVVDPTRRITLAQIRKHTWFQKDLPEYLSGQLRNLSLEKRAYNPDILQELEDMGLRISDKENLRPDEQVAYHLLADRASKQSSFTNLLRKDQRTSDAPGIFDDEEISIFAKLFDQEQGAPLYKLTPVAGERSVIISQAPNTAAECPWQLGFEAVMEAAVLMTEVLVTLRDLGYEWHNITPWRVKARPVGKSQIFMMLTVQVYKSASGKYLVDVLISQGPSLPALQNALHFLRQLAEREAVAPNIVTKSSGNLLAVDANSEKHMRFRTV